MAMKTMNLAMLPVWIIVAIQIFQLGVGETFKWFKGGCSNYTFHVNSFRLNWEQSRQLCKKTGLGDLVSIESYAEWMFLKNTILKFTITDEYFIGLRKDHRFRQWKWLSNRSTIPKELPWVTEEPNGFGDCASMYKDYRRDYGKYNDLDCTRHSRIIPGYICESPVDGCNQEGASRGDKRCSCYTFESDLLMSWPIAMGSCKLINKELVVIETEREWKFLTMEIQTRKSGKYDEWHIGLYKSLITGKWTWISGKALTIDKWQDNTPNDNDSYTLMAKQRPPGFKGSFKSIIGNTSRGWICEGITDNCQGVCLRHDLVQSPKAIASTTQRTVSPTQDPARDPEGGKQAYNKDNCFSVVIILASLVAVLSAALLILGVCFLSWRKKQRKGNLVSYLYNM